MDKKIVTLILTITLLSLTILVGAKSVSAVPDVGNIYSSGLRLFSPLNTTYTTNTLNLSVSFKMGGVPTTINYTLDDGKASGDIPLTYVNSNETMLMANYEGNVQLPKLSDGTHALTITVDAELNDYRGPQPPGAPFHATNPEGTNYAAIWIHTIYFTVDTSKATPTPTPIAVTSPTASPTNQSVAGDQTQTMQPPVSEQSQSAPIAAIIIVAACSAYIAVIAVLVAKKK